MSQFNTYAQRLDAAFKEARSLQAATQAALDEAKSKVEKFDRFQPQRFAGENDAKLTALRADLRDAEQTYKAALDHGWDTFNRTRAKIKAELEAAVQEAGRATPEQVSIGTLELIKSGILTVDEIEALCQRFANENNSAMLRIIGKYALERVEKEPSNADKHRLSMVAHIAAQGEKGVMRAWDQLEDVATRFLGYNPLTGRVDPIPNAAAQWESVTSAAIEAF